LIRRRAPLEGWRHVKVSDRHTAIDYAHTLRDLSDVHFLSGAMENCPLILPQLPMLPKQILVSS
jgi:hypothetical protein